MKKVSCFMIVRNVLSQGYPFLEAIAQALPVCDEFLISDGMSDDGTYQLLERAARVNKKIRLFREEWQRGSFHEELREATNRLLRKCQGDYVFYVQANEVVHEESWKYLKQLPEIWPEAITFSFPYLLVFRHLRFHEQYRLRYAKRLDYIEAIYDAWALGLSTRFVIKELLSSLFRPRQLARILYKGVHAIYADTGGITKLTVPVILPQPIYRYQAVFLGDPIAKELERTRRWGGGRGREELERKLSQLSECDSEEKLLEIVKSARKVMRARGHQVPDYPEGLMRIPPERHPRIMRGLLEDKTSCRYYVREEIFDILREV
ncbi:MAG: glycosyltransferase family 2 protein [Acidilobaceae archaeon]|nr:glycosyltransferase family 2 protein [Acidilobaceae archaeon]MCX8165734.1 glycosyltransferase family 2 protein [Acidilobaceae archaeon]MDW7974159.1 glycosyltransferase family 2 protein [Sulfolobales archaeon]